MSTFNAILPFGLLAGALFAVFFAFSKPVSLLPRWVRHAYLLLAFGMAGMGVAGYLKTHYQSSFSESANSLLLQARAWFSGFSLGILIVLLLAGVFPVFLGRSNRIEPPARRF